MSGGGNVVITMGNGGTVEYSHATYTCVSGEGCGIENGRVTAGTIRVSEPSAAENPTPIPTATATATRTPTPTPKSTPSPTFTATPEPTSRPTATPVRPGKFSEFNGAGAAAWQRMHESGQIVACYEGLALPRDRFCLSEGFRFSADYSEILDAKFLVAHLPDGDALVLQGNTTSRAGGDIRLGWIIYEDRVITHLEFDASQTSPPAATETPSPTATPTRAQSDPDRAVLIALYHSTGGANWDANTNWLSDRPIGEWLGVTTDSNGRVIRLLLPNYNLTGEIPPELGGLSNLTVLVFQNNQLTGEIPPELGDLTNLIYLFLDGNQLTGEIPPELGGLSALEELYLGENRLTGEIPLELGDLSNLQRLSLYTNQLTGEIPPELGDLTNLIYLFLDGNQLTGEIPPELGGLSNLTELFLGENRLTGEIPLELGDLSNLQRLSLYTNQLTGEIPPELGRLTYLTELSLEVNRLEGQLPSELGKLTSLTVLRLGWNQLTGDIPRELAKLTKLTELDFRYNLISEISPLSGLPMLQEVLLRDNHITDVAPLASNPGLGEGDLVDVRKNPLSDVSIDTHIPALKARGVNVSFDEFLVFTEPQIYNDNVFILPVSGDIAKPDVPLREYAARFYEHFNDEFDFLMFVPSLGQGEAEGWEERGAFYASVRNDVQGIGSSVFSDDSWGSVENLQGVIYFVTYATYDSGRSILSDGTPQHELLHRWANFVAPTGFGAHWGFSSADGYLGGFDIANLVDHGNGRYTAGNFQTTGWSWKEGPDSHIELYLAGFIPPEEVPDLWVAEDGEWLLDQDGDRVLAENGYPIFTASRVRIYSIDDIIAEHGARVPDASNAQKDFRAAVILLVDENHPATRERLQRLSADVAWFSHPDAVEADQDNFYESTGGRGTITMGGLSQFLKGDQP